MSRALGTLFVVVFVTGCPKKEEAAQDESDEEGPDKDEQADDVALRRLPRIARSHGGE